VFQSQRPPLLRHFCLRFWALPPILEYSSGFLPPSFLLYVGRFMRSVAILLGVDPLIRPAWPRLLLLSRNYPSPFPLVFFRRCRFPGGVEPPWASARPCSRSVLRLDRPARRHGGFVSIRNPLLGRSPRSSGFPSVEYFSCQALLMFATVCSEPVDFLGRRSLRSPWIFSLPYRAISLPPSFHYRSLAGSDNGL